MCQMKDHGFPGGPTNDTGPDRGFGGGPTMVGPVLPDTGDALVLFCEIFFYFSSYFLFWEAVGRIHVSENAKLSRGRNGREKL